mmetsp:Transcript_49585/g.111409  ORF Transcript_49585/g.111409 Transcript_49585/m.111409 type:complete len:446 (-) Transcript_49585:119-1456(-)
MGGVVTSNGKAGAGGSACCDYKRAQNVCIGGPPLVVLGKQDEDGMHAGTVVSMPVQGSQSEIVEEQLAGYAGLHGLEGTTQPPIEPQRSNGSEPYSGQSGGLASNQSARTLTARTGPQRVLAPRGNSDASGESSGSSKHGGDPQTPNTPGGSVPDTPISAIRENGNTGLPTRLNSRGAHPLESPGSQDRLRRHSWNGSFLRGVSSEWDSENVVTPISMDSVNDFFINQPEFEVDFVDERLPLGVKVFNAENKILVVVDVEKDGALGRWNAAHPDTRVQRGDIVVEISGLGRGPVSAFEMFFSKELEQMMSASSTETFSRQIRLRHDAFEVSLAGEFGEDQVLGLELAPVPTVPDFLIAKRIGEGLVQTWNEAAGPYNVCINVGDIIIEANGVSGNAHQMLDAIRKSTNAWSLRVVHVQTPTAPAVEMVKAGKSVFGSHGSHPTLV